LPTTSKREGIAGQGEACRFRRRLRGKTHSSHGGRKAYLNFELKDAPKARGLRPSQILDFKIQMRSGQPRDEWGSVAGAAAPRANANRIQGFGKEYYRILADRARSGEAAAAKKV
jgi:hypothetical protein